MNFAGGDAAGCPGLGHEEQGGAGGNSGALYFDGATLYVGGDFQLKDADFMNGLVRILPDGTIDDQFLQVAGVVSDLEFVDDIYRSYILFFQRYAIGC